MPEKPTLRSMLRDWTQVVRTHFDPERPPVVGWWLPVIGVGLHYAVGGAPWLLKQAKRRDEVFSLHFLGRETVIANTPEFVRTLYHSPFEEVSFWEALELYPTFETLVPLGASGPEHANLGVMTLRSHLSHVVLGASAQLDDDFRECYREKIGPAVIDADELFRHAILRVTSRLLAGGRVADDRVFQEKMLEFDAVVNEAVRTMGDEEVMARGMALRGLVITRIYNEVERRMREGYEGEARDFLDAMIAARQPDTGEALSIDVIASDMVGYHFGTTANTPAAATMMLAEILERPALLRRLEAEQAAVMETHGDHIDKRALRKMPLLTACYRETLRRYAPGLHLRITTAPVQVGKYLIPKDTLIALSPYVIHHDPETYEDPEVFDPDRWVDGPRKPAGAPPSTSFIPFGRGEHACLGRNLARQEIVLCIARLIRDYRLTLADRAAPRVSESIDWQTNGVARPKHVVRISARRREASLGAQRAASESTARA